MQGLRQSGQGNISGIVLMDKVECILDMDRVFPAAAARRLLHELTKIIQKEMEDFPGAHL